jgi:hypothetical protein
MNKKIFIFFILVSYTVLSVAQETSYKTVLDIPYYDEITRQQNNSINESV